MRRKLRSGHFSLVFGQFRSFACFLGDFLTRCFQMIKIYSAVKYMKNQGFLDGFVKVRPKVDNSSQGYAPRSLNPQHIRGFPAQMLTAINTEQLPRHAGRIQKIAKRRRDVRGIGTASQNGVGALIGEVLR